MKKKLVIGAIILITGIVWANIKDHSGNHTYTLYRTSSLTGDKIAMASFNTSGEHWNWNYEHCHYAIEGIKPYHKVGIFSCEKE